MVSRNFRSLPSLPYMVPPLVVSRETIIPGASGTQRLTRLIGISKARDLIFTARALMAHQALNPSEKPGERQRAWLVTGESSISTEPRRTCGGNVATTRDLGLDPTTRIAPSRVTLISTRCSRRVQRRFNAVDAFLQYPV